MKRRDFVRRWLWRLPLAFLGLSAMSYAQPAAAWNWDDVQRWAYEVEDRSDDVYQQAYQEANEGNPDQEYALELLWDLSVKADTFSTLVNANPWGASALTRSAYVNLYNAFYRADQALDYAPFSAVLKMAFNNLSWAMERLRVEYNYSYVSDGWLYHHHRDYWYFTLRHRHNRTYCWPIYIGRIERRRVARYDWERRYQQDSRRRAYERVRRDRIERDRRDRGSFDRDRHRPGRNVQPPRRDNDRDRGGVTPPRRDNGGNGGGRDRGGVTPPRRDNDRDRGSVNPPRRDNGGNSGGRDRGGVTPPRRDNGGNSGGRDRGGVTPPRRDNGGSSGGRDRGGVTPPRRDPPSGGSGRDRGSVGRDRTGGGSSGGGSGRTGGGSGGGDRGSRRPPRP